MSFCSKPLLESKLTLINTVVEKHSFAVTGVVKGLLIQTIIGVLKILSIYYGLKRCDLGILNTELSSEGCQPNMLF